jgi:hypothetical protein
MEGGDEEAPEYYVIGVEPDDPRQLAHSIVPCFESVRELLGDDDLCAYWGYYLEDLREIFDCPSDGVTAADFFTEHAAELLASACYYVADSDDGKLAWEIQCYANVAVAHRLTLSPAQTSRALIRMAAALTAISATDE